MKNTTMARLYIKHLIEPLEEIVKNPDFKKNYTKEERQMINQFLLKQYRNLEEIQKENQ